MSDFNVSSLRIKRSAVHKVFEKQENQATSDCIRFKDFTEVTLPQEIIKVIKKRLGLVTAKKAHELEIKSHDEYSFFHQCCLMKEESDHDKFVDITANIAGLLAKAQTRRGIRDAFLWVLEGEDIDTSKKIWIVIKAELHEALTFDGDVCKFLDEVFLSPTQKLYKVGILYERKEPIGDKSFPDNEYGCLLVDSNWKGSVSKLAGYFCTNFLGFSYENIAKYQIASLYEYVGEFIKKAGLSTDEQIKALENVNLHFEATSVIHPDSIGALITNDPDLQGEFIDHVYKFPGAITTDLNLIQKKLDKCRLPFENQIIINGPRQDFTRSVTVVDTVEKLRDFAGEILQSISNGFTPNYTVVRINSKPIS